MTFITHNYLCSPLDNIDYFDYIDYMDAVIRGHKGSTPVTVRIDDESLAKLQRLAEKEDRNLAYLVKQAIRVYLTAKDAK